MTRLKLTPQTFDASVTGSRCDPVKRESRIIWTAGAIGSRIGTSADFVRDTLAKQPGTPVRQIGGRYCAVEADLLSFFRFNPTET